jgi:protein-tyrosine phosphatase
VTVREVEIAGLRDCHEGVRDFSAPTIHQLERATAFINSEFEARRAVVVSYGAGYGRTSTILAAWLVSRGECTADALTKVKTICVREPETPEQVEVLREFERTRAHP